MILREYLNRHLRRATILCWLSVAAFLVGLFALARDYYFWPVPMVITVIFDVLALYHTVRGRCPRCGTAIMFALGGFGVRLSLPKWFNSCPSCGLSFDTQRDARLLSESV